MHKGTMTDDRRVAQRWALLTGLTLLIGLILGSLLASAHFRQDVRPVQSDPHSTQLMRTPQPSLQDSHGEAWSMSPRAAAQYRAFYAQQMESEAALERWAGQGRGVERAEPLHLTPRLGDGLPRE